MQTKQKIRPYYSEPGVTIYRGDARELCRHLSAETVITDPVWPNSIFPDVENPQQLLTDALSHLVDPKRVVIHLGCDSDPRFLAAVPARWPFFRACWLEYAVPSYAGRVLKGSDVAYVFGEAPAWKIGGRVIPGKCISTQRGVGFQTRGVGRNKDRIVGPDGRQVRNPELSHPCPRHLAHLRWLVKWFAGASVIDPFMGSGTTLVACKALGIPVIGIEMEERYCELAVSRLGQGVLDLVGAG